MHETVLLVDDESRVTEALTRTLHGEAYRILAATSAEMALEILEHESVDVIVSDERMAGMSGTEFLVKVHHDHPETVRMLLTGHATLDVAIRAINSGAIYRFLKKPCEPEEIRCAIRDGLRHKQLVCATHRLLARTREQDRTLRELETSYPGITRVKRDPTGAVILGGGDVEMEDLFRQIDELLDGDHGEVDAAGEESR